MEHEYQYHAAELLRLLPDVRDGQTEAIHQARVVTRKLRAAIPFLEAAGVLDEASALPAALKKAGRALGAARDLDVAIELLNAIETRSPSTAAAAATLRAHLMPERAHRRRQLIKQLESLDLESLLKPTVTAIGRRSTHRVRSTDPRAARAVIHAIPDRTEAVTTAVTHATGVYFPNRAHRARIAVKKLRYLVELLGDRRGGDRPSLRPLKRVQETLGGIHDHEVLLRRLDDFARTETIPGARELFAVLDAECRVRFEKYRALRSDLLETCTGLDGWSRSRRQTRLATRLLQVGAVAVPSAAVLMFANRKSRVA